jgi:hypothetical protein
MAHLFHKVEQILDFLMRFSYLQIVAQTHEKFASMRFDPATIL